MREPCFCVQLRRERIRAAAEGFVACVQTHCNALLHECKELVSCNCTSRVEIFGISVFLAQLLFTFKRFVAVRVQRDGLSRDPFSSERAIPRSKFRESAWHHVSHVKCHTDRFSIAAHLDATLRTRPYTYVAFVIRSQYQFLNVFVHPLYVRYDASHRPAG
jgi:hypothetical protein